MSEQWEHATRTCASGNRDAILKDMGKHGWELVGTADNGWTLFFKRRKTQEPVKP